MAGTDFDVIVGGTKAKILKGDQAGYKKRTVRREVQQNLISQAEGVSLASRDDQRQLYQTSWADGSMWFIWAGRTIQLANDLGPLRTGNL